jgi:hypothetical protein
MSYTEFKINCSSKLHALIITAGFEAYLVYAFVTSFFSKDDIYNDYLLWWGVAELVKISFGYLAYRLYTSQKKKLAILGALIAFIVIASTSVAYWISPNHLSLILGGSGSFLLVANSLFLFRYLKNRDSIKLYASRWHIATEIFLLVVIIDAFAGNHNVILYIGLLLSWITFYLSSEGFSIPKAMF